MNVKSHTEELGRGVGSKASTRILTSTSNAEVINTELGNKEPNSDLSNIEPRNAEHEAAIHAVNRKVTAVVVVRACDLSYASTTLRALSNQTLQPQKVELVVISGDASVFLPTNPHANNLYTADDAADGAADAKATVRGTTKPTTPPIQIASSAQGGERAGEPHNPPSEFLDRYGGTSDGATSGGATAGESSAAECNRPTSESGSLEAECVFNTSHASAEHSPQSTTTHLLQFDSNHAAQGDIDYSHNFPAAYSFESFIESARALFSSSLQVTTLNHARNFFDAILQSCTLHAQHEHLDNQWLWLLHADSAPEPGALAELLRISERSERIGIVGPKQVAWLPLDTESGADSSAANELLEVGIFASRSARRLPETVPGERDQGQLDARLDVLAVGSAGSLLNVQALKDAGGLSGTLGPFGDGIELSRRIRLANYRVVVAPQAVVRHAQQSMGNPVTESYVPRRVAQVFNSLLTVPRLLLPLAWLGYILLALPRAGARLLMRDFTMVGPELFAGLKICGIFGAIVSARRRYKALPASQKSLASLETSPREIRRRRKHNRRILEDAAALANRPSPLVMRAREDLALHTRHGLFAVLLISIVFAVVVHIPLIAHGVLTGGNIGIERLTAAQLWEQATHSWIASGDGSPGSIDALWILYLPLLALGYPFGLTLGMLTTATIYIALPAAAVTAYLMNGRYTLAWHARVVVALIWMISPPFLEALQQGRIGAVVMHIFLPLFVWAWVDAWRGSGSRLALASLLLAVLSASAPLWLPCAVLLTLIALVAAPHSRLTWLWLPVPSFVLYASQLFELRWLAIVPFLFASPGVPYDDVATVRDVLRGFTTRTFGDTILDTALILAVAVIAVSALMALTRGVRTFHIRCGIALAALGLAIAVASRFVDVSQYVNANGIEGVTAWHGIGGSIAWLGICIAIVNGSYSLRTALHRYRFGARQIMAASVLFLLPVSVLVIMGQWVNLSVNIVGDSSPADAHLIRSVAQESALPVQATALSDEPQMVIPAIAESEQNSSAKSRVLVIVPVNASRSAAQAGSVLYSAQIWRGEGLSATEYSMTRSVNNYVNNHLATSENALLETDPLAADVNTAIANLLAGAPQSAEVLGQHAISIVLVPNSDSPANDAATDDLVAALQLNSALDFVAHNDAGNFWRVSPLDAQTGMGARGVARVQLNDLNGPAVSVESGTFGVHTTLEATDDDVILHLAERKDSHWRATLDGVELDRVDNVAGFSQWNIPAGSEGDLKIWYSQPGFIAIRVLQALIAIFTLVAALPSRSLRGGIE